MMRQSVSGGVRPSVGGAQRGGEGDWRCASIMVLLNPEGIRAKQGEQTPARVSDDLAIVPAAEEDKWAGVMLQAEEPHSLRP